MKEITSPTSPPLDQSSGRSGQPPSQHHVVDIDGNKKSRTRPPPLERGLSVRDRQEQMRLSFKYNKQQPQKAAENDSETCETLLEGKQKIDVQDEDTPETKLHIAAKNGEVELLRLYLGAGADCNARDSSGKSPLHVAATKGYLQFCQELLRHTELDVNIKNMNEDTPLHDAAREGRVEVCSAILKRDGVQVDAQNKKGMTPLHIAAQEDHSTVIQLLLNTGASWKHRDRYSYMALHYAAQKGFPESCEALLSADSRSEREAQLKAVLKDKRTPLILAAKGGHHKCCVKLTNGDIVNAQDKDGNTALYYAAQGGFEHTVSELLAREANPDIINKLGNSAILEASGKKKMNCLKILIEKNATVTVVNNCKKTVLHLAAEKNAEECLLFLLDNRDARNLIDSQDTESCTPLHIAIKREAEECANYLLDRGASPTESCKGGMTPLHLAAEKGYTGICQKLLLSPKVNVSQENDNKATALHMAAMHGSTDVCQMLLRKGARTTAMDEKGRTALHIASVKGHDNVVRFLAKKGVPQRAKDDSGSTALHLAASGGWLESCRALVKCAKTLVSEVDQNSKLPLQIAFEEKHDEVFKFLLAQLPYKKQDSRALYLQSCFHKYMHDALRDNRLVAVQAIIDSAWWEAGFIVEDGHHCDNFRTLLEHHPRLALEAQNNCIRREDSNSLVTYDFSFFEDNYYLQGASNASKKLCDEKSGTVVKEAKQFISDDLEWKRTHPVSLMVQHHRTDLLHHPLTKAWLIEKWNLYISYIFLVLLFIEMLFVAALTIFMALTDDWPHIERKCKITKDQFCNLSAASLGNFSTAEDTSLLEEGDGLVAAAAAGPLHKCGAGHGYLGGWIFLLIMTFIILLLEFNNMYRLKREYVSMDNSLKIAKVIFTIILLVPLETCEFHHQVPHEHQWQCGILALLLAWLLLINKINQLPVFSVFMPITSNFIKSFIKVLFYILLLLGLFAYIFHLLLADQSAFMSMPQAMVKTIVWLLGDLGYDDTFLNTDHPLVYPVTTNLLFVIFVTTISGFIVNLFITQSSENHEDTRKRTAFQKAASQSRLMLQLDVCFPYFRKQKTRIRFTKTGSEKMSSNILSKILLLKFDPAEEGAEIRDPLIKKLEQQEQQIVHLVNLHVEHKRELRDLKHQLNTIMRNMSATKTLER